MYRGELSIDYIIYLVIAPKVWMPRGQRFNCVLVLNRYYSIVIVLICLSLALQVVAGIIALFVSHLRVYFTRYHDDAMEDICENLCCCRAMCRTRTPQPHLSGVDKGDRLDGNEAEKPSKRVAEGLPLATRLNTSRKVTTNCSPCCITARIFPDYDYAIIDAYEEWRLHYTEKELGAAVAELEIKHLMGTIEDARGKLGILEQHKTEYDIEEFQKRFDEIQTKTEEAAERKLQFEDVQQQAKISQARGDILWERANAVRKNQVLKRASFWQHTINYIFYVVFVLNVFITGLGITQYATSTLEPIGFGTVNNTSFHLNRTYYKMADSGQ